MNIYFDTVCTDTQKSEIEDLFMGKNLYDSEILNKILNKLFFRYGFKASVFLIQNDENIKIY